MSSPAGYSQFFDDIATNQTRLPIAPKYPSVLQIIPFLPQRVDIASKAGAAVSYAQRHNLANGRMQAFDLARLKRRAGAGRMDACQMERFVGVDIAYPSQG